MSRFIAPAFFLVALLTAVAIRLLPHDGGPVAVLAWPPEDGGVAARVIAAAGGRLLTAGQGGFLIAQSDEAGFADRLYAAGALLVMRADAVPCGALDGADPR